jgi:hypothetical protein
MNIIFIWRIKMNAMNAMIRAFFYKLPKINDVYYLDCGESDNPFKKQSTIIVIDVKNGYIYYDHGGSDFLRYDSLSKSSFNFIYKKLED